MSICFDGNSSGLEVRAPSNRFDAEFRERDSRCLRIGLINNMPDAAMEATERQFCRLLDAAADGFLVRLSLLALPGVPRSEASRQRINRFYSAESLWNSHFDALIVTGREPKTADLMAEPYWENLTKALEWADENTHSTVWSCLAAHAAVLHLDGINRRKSTTKHFGVFPCEQVGNHQLMADMPSRFAMPHSRWNGVPEDELSACGYSILTRAQGAGVDTFVKQRKSLFVFFQGHPEYESDTLLLEYRRDVRRYFRGESEGYPLLPHNYFDEDTAAALTALRHKAMSRRSQDLLIEVDDTLNERTISNTWCSTGTPLYRNWLEYIACQKDRGLRVGRAAMGVQRVGSAASFAAGMS